MYCEKGKSMRFQNRALRRIPAMLAAAALACLATASHAESDKITINIKNGENLFLNGKPNDGVPACQSCHGPKALGDDAQQTPRLAGIGWSYVVKQLTNIANGERVVNTNPMMNMVAMGLTEQERRDVAGYLNTLPPASEPSDLNALKASGTPVGESYKGQILVRYGVVGKAPACQSCHGFNGRGADPVYPAIAQQKYVYLVNQLKSWRSGERANDPLGQMRAVAKNLSDEEIYDAAAFLSHAAKSTNGDGFLPNNQSVLSEANIVR